MAHTPNRIRNRTENVANNQCWQCGRDGDVTALTAPTLAGMEDVTALSMLTMAGMKDVTALSTLTTAGMDVTALTTLTMVGMGTSQL